MNIPHMYCIYENVIIGDNVSIHPYAVIGKPPQVPQSANAIYKPQIDKPTIIGNNCVIGAHVVIYQGCKIGNNTLLGDGVRLRDQVTIGDNCIIGMGTKIGPHTIVYDKVKIMDLCNISANMIIEEGVFIAQGTMCANDRCMGRCAADSIKEFIGPTIRRYAAVGANATLLPGIEIGENAIVGAGAVVTENVEARTIVVSPKAKFLRYVTEEELKGD